MKILDRAQEDRIRRHLKIVDGHMRELFSFYWHRRKDGRGPKMCNDLARDIKRGEAILKEFDL